jgi:hypothetical protein
MRGKAGPQLAGGSPPRRRPPAVTADHTRTPTGTLTGWRAGLEVLSTAVS